MVSLLGNEGFEAGALAPWTSNSPATTLTMNAHGGTWAAETNGNFYVQQTFPAVPVAQLTMARFWSWHVLEDVPAMAVDIGYSDNTSFQTIVPEARDGRIEHDILSRSDVRPSVRGDDGVRRPDVTRFDDFRRCRRAAAAAEVACAYVLGYPRCACAPARSPSPPSL